MGLPQGLPQGLRRFVSAGELRNRIEEEEARRRVVDMISNVPRRLIFLRRCFAIFGLNSAMRAIRQQAGHIIPHG